MKQNRIENLEQKKIVLILDDNPISLEIYKASLETSMFDCIFCDSSAEACRIIENQKIDGIVSDLLMPELSGIDVFKKVNRHQTNCFKILATGSGDLRSIIYAVNEIGVEKIMLKPLKVDNDELLETIVECLQNRNLEF